MSKNKNKNGFTMVELLGVIVIIGILSLIGIGAISRLINKTKNTSDEALSKTLESAAKSYVQGNKDKAPKVIGEVKEVTANELKRSNYLTEDLRNSKDEDCMTNSKVQVYKNSSSSYLYSAHLLCGDERESNKINGNRINISINFSEGNDVSKASFKINLKVDNEKVLPKKTVIDSYSYTISVIDGGNTREVYSSGSINGKKRDEINIEKQFSDYMDVSSNTQFVINVVAVSNYGEVFTGDNNTGYNDTVAPICGRKENEGNSSSWLNRSDYEKKNVRTVSVRCSDGDGSGCKRKKFSKTWPNKDERYGAVTSTIPIYDNRNSKVDGIETGNRTDCTVGVYVDIENPSATLNAYSGSSKVLSNKRASYSDPTETINVGSYSDTTNDWMNASDYPNGVSYEISVSDNISGLSKWTWEVNKRGSSTVSTDSISTSNSDGTKGNLSGNKATINVGFRSEGKRYGVLTIYDKAGNKTVYKIYANLDRTSPSCGSTRGESTTWTLSSRTISVGCNDSMSGCSRKSKTFSPSNGTVRTGYINIKDDAGNGRSCGAYDVYVDSCDDYYRDSLDDVDCGSCSTTCGRGNKYCRYTYSTRSNVSGLRCGSTTSSGYESCNESSGCPKPSPSPSPSSSPKPSPKPSKPTVNFSSSKWVCPSNGEGAQNVKSRSSACHNGKSYNRMKVKDVSYNKSTGRLSFRIELHQNDFSPSNCGGNANICVAKRGTTKCVSGSLGTYPTSGWKKSESRTYGAFSVDLSNYQNGSYKIISTGCEKFTFGSKDGAWLGESDYVLFDLTK